MTPLVTFTDVTFSYRRSHLFQNVNLTINQGEFIGIIGPNGTGKTTLLKLMMGLLQPTVGKIETSGATVGYVPQSMRFDRQFPISVFELVLSGRLSYLPWYGKYGRKDKEKAEEALEKVGLIKHRDKAFGTLSGGEAQRALIARALVSEPELLFLDEPTANVDSKAEKEIYSLLDNLHQSITIVMVTHNLRAAIEHVDRVLTVERQVLSFQPEEVCHHFAVGLYHPPLLQEEKK